MPAKKFNNHFPIGKKAGAGIARLFGDKKLGAAIYRLPPSNGQHFGRAGILLSRDSDYGRKYAERLCVCGRPLNFGRLSVYSDGNSKPSLVHYGCASRAILWSRLVLANCYTSHVCFGPSYAIEPETAEPVDLTAVWASFNRNSEAGAEPAESEAELTEQLDRVREVIAEIAEPETAAAE
jgi:hypothetical protein